MTKETQILRKLKAPSHRATQRALPLDPQRAEPTALPSEAFAIDLPSEGPALDDTAAGPDQEPLEAGRSLTVADISGPAAGAMETMIRWAYRIGVPGTLLSSPLSSRASSRLLGAVASPLPGDQVAGTAFRAGHLLVNGLKAPLDQLDVGPNARLTPPFTQVVHGFEWLRDLSSSAPREQAAPGARAQFDRWVAANRAPGKGPAWTVENAGRRLLNWLVHLSLLAGDGAVQRDVFLEQVGLTARWLDRHVRSADDKHGEVVGWAAIVATGLLLSDGRARRIYGEAGLFQALGELVSDDGGVLSRSPLDQMDALAILIDLKACYEAVSEQVPAVLDTMLALLVPPLLTLRHGDGGLGSWQGAGACRAEQVDALLTASGVRARPGKDMREWGYQRISARGAVLQFDAAPPPKARHARAGCASTLAFELSCGEQRLIVNCGGAVLAGGVTPIRIEQGLRATAAHSTLVLDDVNSTAIEIKGRIGKGVDAVEVARATVQQGPRKGTRVEASHDGYAARFGLLHRRILLLRDDGEELRGEDVLVPVGRRGKRGKIGFAIRFHLGVGVDVELSDDRRGAGLVLPDGNYWQFRCGGDDGDRILELEESLWIDGGGRPHATQQLVVSGLTSRGGGQFPWLLKKMG